MAEAIAHLEVAQRLDPDSSLVRYNLALALERIGRLEEAIAAVSRRDSPRPGPLRRGHNNLAGLLLAAGELELARAPPRTGAPPCDRVLRPPRLNLGRLLLSRGLPAAAEEHLRRAGPAGMTPMPARARGRGGELPAVVRHAAARARASRYRHQGSGVLQRARRPVFEAIGEDDWRGDTGLGQDPNLASASGPRGRTAWRSTPTARSIDRAAEVEQGSPVKAGVRRCSPGDGRRR